MSDYMREVAGYQKGSVYDPDYVSPEEVIAEMQESIDAYAAMDPSEIVSPWGTTAKEALELGVKALADLKEKLSWSTSKTWE